MKPLSSLILTISLSLLLTQGCSLPQNSSKVLSIDNSNSRVVTFPSSLRGAYFIDKNSKVKFCAEPAPDVARESLQRLSARIQANAANSTNADAGFNSSLEAKALQLAGRTELLLVAREMLYRACEMSLNNNTSEETVLKVYTEIANLIRELAVSDRKTAEKDLINAETQSRREKAAIKKGADIF